MNTKTLKNLQKIIGGNIWEKGDMKRLYLKKGFNTKKMETKAFVFQLEDGSFAVSVYIDCPSQNRSWVMSQQKTLRESIEKQIEEAFENENTTNND